MKQHLEMGALLSWLLHWLQISHNILRTLSDQGIILNRKFHVTKECNYWLPSSMVSYRADKNIFKAIKWVGGKFWRLEGGKEKMN
jgi:hypothetical protein